MKTHAIILLFTVFLFSAGAQNDKQNISAAFDSLMIHQYSETRWMKGNHVLKKKELFALLRSNPVSAAPFEKARKNQILSRTMSIGALGLLFASIFVSPDQPEIAVGMLGASLAVSLASIPPYIKGDRTLHEAVWLYNRSILTGDSLKVRPPVSK